MMDRFVAIDVEIASRSPIRICAIGAARLELSLPLVTAFSAYHMIGVRLPTTSAFVGDRRKNARVKTALDKVAIHLGNAPLLMLLDEAQGRFKNPQIRVHEAKPVMVSWDAAVIEEYSEVAA
jgi:hypothetical protein